MTTTTTDIYIIYSCVPSAEVVLKLVKPFAHTNKPLKLPKGRAKSKTAVIPTFPRITCHSWRTGEATVEVVLTMKVFAVLLGLITATCQVRVGQGRKEKRAGIRSDCGV